MFTVFSKKHSFKVATDEENFKAAFSEKVPKLNFNELRKQWLMTPVFYGTLKENKITVHHHAAKKRDLDGVFFSGEIKPDDGGVMIDGKFKRSTKNTVMAAVITVLWLLITVACFTQNLIAGFACVIITALCVYLFYWDEGKAEIIKAYLEELADEAQKRN